MPSSLLRSLARVAIAIVATIFLFSLLLAGALMSLLWLGWNLLRGRRPTWRSFDFGAAQGWRGTHRPPPGWARPSRAGAAQADVVEGQAREVLATEQVLRRD